jgi:adenine phosphoribosyltransferase
MPVIETPTTADIQSMVRVIPNHPRPGVMYQDMASIFNHPQGLLKVVTMFKNKINSNGINYDRIVGLDARGFPMAGALSAMTGKPFAMARKKGKLPGETIHTEYELEYGTDELHLQSDSVLEGDRVLVIDDVIATGGTLEAATSLIERMNGEVVGILSIMDLTFLGGSEKLRAKGYPVFSILSE